MTIYSFPIHYRLTPRRDIELFVVSARRHLNADKQSSTSATVLPTISLLVLRILHPRPSNLCTIMIDWIDITSLTNVAAIEEKSRAFGQVS